MITREYIEIAFGDERKPFQIFKDIDYKFKAISLLRERIPYDICKNIIGGASHDKIYLCDVEDSLEYLSECDVDVLADCNMFIDSECECYAMFV